MNTCQKLYILEKKSKITKKIVKNHDFLEKNEFCDVNFSTLLEVYTCARPTSIYSYGVKKFKKFYFVAIFQKISTRDVFCQAYTWYPKFFYVKKTKIFKLWFLAQKVFKMAYFGPWGNKKYILGPNKNFEIFRFLDLEKFQNFFIFC